MKLIIFGATGHSGNILIEQALAQNHEVTAFVRDPSKLILTNPHLKVVRGDALDGTAVARAMRGHQAVLSALNVPALEPTTLLSDATKNVIQAMEQYRLKRLVTILSAGLLTDSVPSAYANIVAEHQRILEMLQASRLDWVAACPATITNDPRIGHYRATAQAMPPNGWVVSKYDLADFLLTQLTRDEFLRQPVGIAN